MKFIKLTLAQTNTPVLINVNNISFVSHDFSGSYSSVYLRSETRDSDIYVNETVEHIEALIGEEVTCA